MKTQQEHDLVEKPFCEQLNDMGWKWLESVLIDFIQLLSERVPQAEFEEMWGSVQEVFYLEDAHNRGSLRSIFIESSID